MHNKVHCHTYSPTTTTTTIAVRYYHHQPRHSRFVRSSSWRIYPVIRKLFANFGKAKGTFRFGKSAKGVTWTNLRSDNASSSLSRFHRSPHTLAIIGDTFGRRDTEYTPDDSRALTKLLAIFLVNVLCRFSARELPRRNVETIRERRTRFRR